MVARRIFPQEFREEAVRRAEEPGVRVAELATELDVNISVLRRWIKEKKAGRWENHVPYSKRPKAVPAIASSDPQEKPPKVSSSNQELQQHLAIITQERDMLKQMLAFYLNKQ
jgi:transposase-like protein